MTLEQLSLKYCKDEGENVLHSNVTGSVPRQINTVVFDYENALPKFSGADGGSKLQALASCHCKTH